MLIPEASVVWQSANPMVYLRKGQNEFTPVVIPTGDHAPGGYFVADGTDAALKPGAFVVVSGAALLLSESELPAASASGAAGGDDAD